MHEDTGYDTDADYDDSDAYDSAYGWSSVLRSVKPLVLHMPWQMQDCHRMMTMALSSILFERTIVGMAIVWITGQSSCTQRGKHYR